jgi:hypothetical protein
MGSAIGKRSLVRKLAHSPLLVYYQVHEKQRMVELRHSGMGRGSRRNSEMGLSKVPYESPAGSSRDSDGNIS